MAILRIVQIANTKYSTTMYRKTKTMNYFSTTITLQELELIVLRFRTTKDTTILVTSMCLSKANKVEISNSLTEVIGLSLVRERTKLHAQEIKIQDN